MRLARPALKRELVTEDKQLLHLDDLNQGIKWKSSSELYNVEKEAIVILLSQLFDDIRATNERLAVRAARYALCNVPRTLLDFGSWATHDFLNGDSMFHMDAKLASASKRIDRTPVLFGVKAKCIVSD